MKLLSLVSYQTSKHQYKKAPQEYVDIPNYLARQFAVTGPDYVWVCDVTYVQSSNYWMCLTVVMDFFALKPICWAVFFSLDSQLTRKTSSIAFESRGKLRNILFHSVQGNYYTSRQYRQLLWYYQMKQSLSWRGNCWDNAPMERLFRSLKTEWVPILDCRNFIKTQQEITYH